jgi:SsrA-binding protein
MFIENMHIALYEKGNIFNHKEDRQRKLLLHKKEIIKLSTKVKLEGLTIIPLEVYISKGLAKIKIGLCKGKKLFDKRNDIKEKSIKRDLEKNYKSKI